MVSAQIISRLASDRINAQLFMLRNNTNTNKALTCQVFHRRRFKMISPKRAYKSMKCKIISYTERMDNVQEQITTDKWCCTTYHYMICRRFCVFTEINFL